MCALTVTGKLVEEFFRVAKSTRVSTGAVSEVDLPDYVWMTLDGYGSERKVKCFPDDRTLAVRVARGALTKLGVNGLHTKDALVNVVGPRGKKIGEHDLLLEIVLDDVPPAAVPRDLISCEVKLRRLWSGAGRAQVRADLRKECCDKLAWWTRVSNDYGGRLILMAVFPEKEDHPTKANDFTFCADLKLKGQQRWTAVFGWDDSVRRLGLALMPPPPPPPPPRAHVSSTAKAKAQPKVQANAKAKAKAQAKAVAAPLRSASVFVARLRFKDGYAEVKGLLQVIPNGNDTKSSYWATKTKARHAYGDAQIFQRPRDLEAPLPGKKRKREGGSKPWVATEEVLKQMCIDMRVADVP